MSLICRAIVTFLKLTLIFHVIETKESVSMSIARKGVLNTLFVSDLKNLLIQYEYNQCMGFFK